MRVESSDAKPERPVIIGQSQFDDTTVPKGSFEIVLALEISPIRVCDSGYALIVIDEVGMMVVLCRGLVVLATNQCHDVICQSLAPAPNLPLQSESSRSFHINKPQSLKNVRRLFAFQRRYRPIRHAGWSILRGTISLRETLLMVDMSACAGVYLEFYTTCFNSVTLFICLLNS
jgi:hypothetical protein